MKVKVFEIPFVASEALCEPEMRVVGGNASLVIGRTSEHSGCVIKFLKQRAIRKRSELYCTAWHVDGAFDTLCEVVDSNWVDELKGDMNFTGGKEWIMRHFMIYLDGFGCTEVVCESASIVEHAE